MTVVTNVKNTPGFTAEKAIYKTTTPHRIANTFSSQGNYTCVRPALPNLCDSLSSVVWGAWLEGDYALAQLAYDAMQYAGCFR
jgi:hypothetical protein